MFDPCLEIGFQDLLLLLLLFRILLLILPLILPLARIFKIAAEVMIGSFTLVFKFNNGAIVFC